MAHTERERSSILILPDEPNSFLFLAGELLCAAASESDSDGTAMSALARSAGSGQPLLLHSRDVTKDGVS